MRYVHRIKREAEQGPEQQPGPELRQGELPLEDDHAALDGRAETVERTATTAPSRSPAATPADAGAPATDAETAKPDWLEPYEALRMPRMQALADNRDILAETRAPLIRALENHQRDLSARKYVADYLDAAERHMGNHAALQSAAESLDIPIAEVPDHPDWRQKADRLAAAGEAILSDKEAYGVHLDHIPIGDTRLNWALSDLRETIRRDSASIREDAVIETQERPSPAPTPQESAREAQSKVHEFRRLQSAAYHASGDERKAARKAFEDYRARESKHYTTPVEDRRHARGMDRAIQQGSDDTPEYHEETQQQPSSPQTDEERRREAQSKAHEFRRLQSAAYNATGDERIAAQKAFDDYREREFKKNEKHEEKKRQTRKKSKGLRMHLQ